MRFFFTLVLALSAALYVAAELTLDRPPDDGVIRIRWATDPNPARNLQTALFARRQLILRAEDVPDWPAFCGALVSTGRTGQPGRPAAARMLWELLPDAARSAAQDSIAAAAPEGRRQVVLDALNGLLERKDLFTPDDAAGLALSRDGLILLHRRTGRGDDSSARGFPWQKARRLLSGPADDKPLTDVEVMALNRRIVEAAFPAAVRKAVRIEATVESGAAEKLIVQCATGTGPDVIDVYGLNQMLTYVEAGILVDLTPYAAKEGFGPENTYPSIHDTLLVEGRQYRYPCNVWANCVIYSRKVFDDHGVPYPRPDWTMDDFIRASTDILNKPSRSGEKHLAVANWNSQWTFEDFLIGYGGRSFTPDGLTSLLDSPEAVAAMQLYHDLMHVHRVLPTPAEAAAMSSQGGWGSGGINWFSSGRAAMIFIGRWYLIQVANYPEIRGHMGAARLPRIAGRPSAGQTDCRGAGINILSPHRQAGLRFLQYLAGPQYGRLIVQDGDSLPPNPLLARTGGDLVNQAGPDPDFHQPFIDAMAPARPLEASPFIDGGQVSRWVLETIGKVENRLVSPPDGMKALAAEINARIRLNLQRRGDLQRKYEKLTGRPYTPDWYRETRKP